MKRLLTSDITTTIGFMPKKGTWEFLQDAYKEAFKSILISLISERYGVYSSGIPYAIYGCKSTNLGATTQFGEGAIFYGNELYLSPGQIVTNPSGSDVFVIRRKDTPYTTYADPNSFTDGTPRNVHIDRTAEYIAGASLSGNLGDYSAIKYPFEESVETKTGVTINGDTIDFIETKTILYDLTVSATATPSLTLDLSNALVGNKVRCIFAPSNSSSIAVTSITETGASIIDRTPSMLPTSPSAWCFVEYEYIGDTIVVRTIARYNP